MCGLYGFSFYGADKDMPKGLNELLEVLGEESAVRGTDATGYSYVRKGKVITNKAPVSAYKLKVTLPENTRLAMGHTRNTTQGSAKKNANNHPFNGYCKRGGQYAFAHNGVLDNELDIRQIYGIKSPRIDTDSYVAVQLLNKIGGLDHKSFKEMGEAVEGMFAFTMIDTHSNLHIIKNDSPFHMVHFKSLKLYVYASTESILFGALLGAKVTNEAVKEGLEKGNVTLMEPEKGDILTINNKGEIESSKFVPTVRYSYSAGYYANYAKASRGGGVSGVTSWDYTRPNKATGEVSKVISMIDTPPVSMNTPLDSYYDNEYNWKGTGELQDDETYKAVLISELAYHGFSEDDMNTIVATGYSLVDIEDALYTGDMEEMLFECTSIGLCAEDSEIDGEDDGIE